MSQRCSLPSYEILAQWNELMSSEFAASDNGHAYTCIAYRTTIQLFYAEKPRCHGCVVKKYVMGFSIPYISQSVNLCSAEAQCF